MREMAGAVRASSFLLLLVHHLLSSSLSYSRPITLVQSSPRFHLGLEPSVFININTPAPFTCFSWSVVLGYPLVSIPRLHLYFGSGLTHTMHSIVALLPLLLAPAANAAAMPQISPTTGTSMQRPIVFPRQSSPEDVRCGPAIGIRCDASEPGSGWCCSSSVCGLPFQSND